MDVQLDAPAPAIEGAGVALFIYWRGEVPVGLRWAGQGPAEPLPLEQQAPPAPAGPLPSLTIAICTRDRPDELAALLALLTAAPGARQILVVDNAPRDDATRRVVSRFGVDYRLAPRPGVTYARNVAWRAAAGEVVAFLDDDCRPAPGWGAALARAFAAPTVAACTGPVLPLELATPAQLLMERRGGFCRGFRRTLYTLESHAAPGATYPLQAWRFGSGANMAVRRELLAQLKGFDERLPVGEDIDLLFRVVRAGGALLYEPAVCVRHRHLRDYAALRRRLYRWGWAYGAFLGKVMVGDRMLRGRAARELSGVVRHHLRQGRSTGWPRALQLAELAGLAMGVAAAPRRFLLRSGAQRSG